ncbi:MAG: FmdB family zinc ribbon protein [Acidimicrobiales bacterium]
MPTYEYVCRSCDAHLEVVQRFDDESLTECPSCAGSLRKVFGSIGIAFKGSGFYKNDSRKVAKSGNGAGSKGTDGSKESAKDGAKTSDGGGGKESGSGSKDGASKEAAPAAKESSGSKPSSASSSSSSSKPSAQKSA